MSKWVQGTVVGKRQWTQDLYSLQVAAPEVTFVAGQFGRLALPAPPGSKEDMIGRPYSFVNSPARAAARVLLHHRSRRAADAAARRARAGRSDLAAAARERFFLGAGDSRRRCFVVSFHRVPASARSSRFCARRAVAEV
jgi:ferredoxin-NADP reductase